MAGSGKKERVYHYTSEENAKSILESGVIEPSTGGRFGGGKVYVTKMTPDQGKKAIARNNYDGVTGQYWEGREAQGSVDVAIPIDVPAHRLKKEKSGRDIYTIEGTFELPK